MTEDKKLEQLVDWRAAVWAALISAVVFLIATWVVVPRVSGLTHDLLLRYFAVPWMGSEVLDPAMPMSFLTMGVAVSGHFGVSLVVAALIAVVVHEYGLVVGIVGGSIIGGAMYFINMYSLTYFVPELYVLRGPAMLIAHIVFGTTAGTVYEMLEVQRFVDSQGREVQP